MAFGWVYEGSRLSRLPIRHADETRQTIHLSRNVDRYRLDLIRIEASAETVVERDPGFLIQGRVRHPSPDGAFDVDVGPALVSCHKLSNPVLIAPAVRTAESNQPVPSVIVISLRPAALCKRRGMRTRK